jgi:hypothetical protein
MDFSKADQVHNCPSETPGWPRECFSEGLTGEGERRTTWRLYKMEGDWYLEVHTDEVVCGNCGPTCRNYCLNVTSEPLVVSFCPCCSARLV